ncbi:MAG: biotin--[acetyl-CoA-carboxylase] ligase [Treponema sp.]|nr:biotin--[acetyl-CoA-carboxylase] ligase [Treponema sp.]
MKTLRICNPFDAPVYNEETVSSTMEVIRDLAAQNQPHGTVIAADFQEAGRGRLNRSWVMDRGKNLMFSILLRYPAIPCIPAALTLKTGLAVSLAVEDIAPALQGRVMVKWPNDVMICRPEGLAAKAAGILTEGDGKNVYIGVGVNVAQEEFPQAHRWKAGSIIQAVPALPENARVLLLEKILARLYAEIETPSPAPPCPAASWHQRLSQRLYKKGEQVVFAAGAADSSSLVEGTLSGIGSGGELIIVPNGGTVEQAFLAGELRVYPQ